jgi:hypothetical protein
MFFRRHEIAVLREIQNCSAINDENTKIKVWLCFFAFSVAGDNLQLSLRIERGQNEALLSLHLFMMIVVPFA